MNLSVIKKYFNIIITIIKISIVRDTTFRVNFFNGILIVLTWQIETFLLTFFFIGKFKSIAGWSSEDLLLLLFTMRAINGLMHFFFYPSLSNLPNLIGTGDLDFLLTRPINKLFISSVRHFGFHNFIDFLFNFVMMLIFIPEFEVIKLIIFFTLFLMGVLLQYFIWLGLDTIAFHSGTLYGLFDIFTSLRSKSRFPLDSYNGINILFMFLILPFLLITSIPVSILINKYSINLIIFYILIFLLIGTGVLIFWKYSLRRYSSASS